MKKVFLAITLFLLAISSFSQTDSMYTDGKKWMVGDFIFENEDAPTVIGEYYLTYTINGDTLINGNIYKKMYYSYTTSEGTFDVNYHPIYLVRVENGKHLYHRPKDKLNGGWWYDEEDFIGDDYIFFDENEQTNKFEIRDTIFENTDAKKRKYFKYRPYVSVDYRFVYALNYVAWVEGIGSLSQPYPYHINAVDCPCYNMVLCCVESTGDTIYKNQKFIDLLEPYLKTDISKITADEITITPSNGGCLVTLGSDAVEWTATLYNSNGVTVAQQQCSGSEAFLSTDSKGTHILVMKAGGRVVKKKIVLR